MTSNRPDPQTFRATARQWINDTIPAFLESVAGDEPVTAARKLQRVLFDAGYAGFVLPVEYGGAGLDRSYESAFEDELNRHPSPLFERLGVSLNIIGETIARYGDDDQRRKYLPQILSGEKVFVQLLSEPSGGSDLAALRTRADRDGDGFVINGSKIWSTGAEEADMALAPARTNWDVPKHNGISVFLIDLHAPGVDVRPIKQIDGEAEFCEVFLTDVWVDVLDVIGEVDDGWTVIRGLLGIEHEWAGRRRSGRRGVVDVTEIVELARRRGVVGDPLVQEQIVDLYVRTQTHRALTARIGRLLAARAAPGGYGALLKLSSDALVLSRAELGLALSGPAGVAWNPEDAEGGHWSHQFLNSRSVSIAGGTDEIQRNNIAERVMGLPRDAKPESVPFREELHN